MYLNVEKLVCVLISVIVTLLSSLRRWGRKCTIQIRKVTPEKRNFNINTMHDSVDKKHYWKLIDVASGSKLSKRHSKLRKIWIEANTSYKLLMHICWCALIENCLLMRETRLTVLSNFPLNSPEWLTSFFMAVINWLTVFLYFFAEIKCT